MSIEINPKETTIITFDVDVSGSKETPTPRLVIPVSESTSLVFEGQMEDGSVSVDVSELLKLTDSTEFSGKLEVIIEDTYFVPWEETLKVIRPIEVQAEAVQKTEVKEEKVVVKAKQSKETKPVAEKKEEKGKLIGEAPKKVMKIKKSVEDLFSDKLDK